jgi:YD repeat-containing protein
MAVAAPTGIIIGPLGRGEVTTRGQLVERHLRDAQYRLNVYDAEDRLIAPVMPIVADNDAAATEQAEQMLDGVRADLRDEDRLVRRFLKE